MTRGSLLIAMAKKKVLVVDDNHDTLFLVCEILRENDYECLTADTPQEGLRIAERDCPNLILLDLMLPGMSGFGFIREKNRNKKLKDIPVVILSVINDDEVEGALADLGAVAYVRKVCNHQELLTSVAANVA